MPLYLSDEDIDLYFREDVAIALWAIRLHADDIAVTPALALRLIKMYLQHLIPSEHWHVLYERKVATWNGIFGIYGALGSCCSSNDDPLIGVMNAIKLIHSHTTRPPRDYEFPTVIEVTYFLHICGYLKIPVQDIWHPEADRHVDPLCYCTLCWRQPLPGRKLCAHHAPNAPLMSDGKTGAAARYKAGVRQKERFDKAVNRILTKEVTEFHEGLFTPEVLLPEQGIAQWLAARRPALWQLLSDSQQRELTDDNNVSVLLDVLHSPEGLSPKAFGLYTQINRHIQAYPLLLWPMLLRAEGWYRSRQEMQEKWGGQRQGAGRPRKTLFSRA